MGVAEIISLVLSAIAVIGYVGGSIWSNQREQKNYENSIEYNSPVNQVARLEEAGLNPNLAAGATNTVNVSQPTVTNPAESLISGLGGMMNQYNDAQGIALRKANQRINEAKLAITQEKLLIQKSLAEQALSKGDLDLALKALNYDTASQTQPYVVSKAIADAGLAGNRAAMSDIDLASYQDYVDNRLALQEAGIGKTNAETFYLQNVKPALEWERVNTSKSMAEETSRHNKELEKLQLRYQNMSDAQRRREYNLNVKKYNEAVRMNNWEKAHFYMECAMAAAGYVGRGYLKKRFGYPTY